MGFRDLFPFYGNYKKDLSEYKCIYVDTVYCLKKGDVVEDEDDQVMVFYIKVTVIDIEQKPAISFKIFKNVENVIKYLKTVAQ